MNIFEQATKQKLRFDTNKGSISTEDLWDLPLTSKTGVCLDQVYKVISKEVRETQEDSLVSSKTTLSELLKLKLDIVKHIAEAKIAERKEKEEAAAKKAQKDKITEILARKQNASLENLSEEALKEMLKNL